MAAVINTSKVDKAEPTEKSIIARIVFYAFTTLN